MKQNKRLLQIANLYALACLLVAQPLAAPAVLAQTSNVKNEAARQAQLAGDKLILHVINRLTFGARPGDIAQVRAIGVNRFIEAQLHPEKIDDKSMEARLANFPALRMTNAELLARYPQPGQILRRLQQQGGDVPEELKDLIDKRQPSGMDNQAMTMKNQALPNSSSGNASPSIQISGSNQTATNQAATNQVLSTGNATSNRRGYRQAMAAYYKANGLEFPQRIMQELQAARTLRAVYSKRQLQEVMVDFWTNHFNVYANKGADKWYLVQYDRDVIRPHALGNFRDLLAATARSPAMLFYLDNYQSVAPATAANNRRRGANRTNRNPNRNSQSAVMQTAGAGAMNRQANRQTNRQASGQAKQNENAVNENRARRGINENYARELMELHTVGVDGGYTQADIIAVARAFTGWTIYAPRGRENRRLNRLAARLGEDLEAGEFFFNPRAHDAGEKVVLGHKIAAGGGIEDGEKVLDILVAHPSTAKHIAAKLARKFIADAPQAETVSLIAAAFTRSKGDIKETLRAVFHTPEFMSEANFRAKIKSPFELAASAMRALAVDTDARPQLHNYIARMGESLYGYQAPTGYPDTAEQWVNTGALLERLNFGVALAANRIPGTRYHARNVGLSVAGDTPDRTRLIDVLLNELLGGYVTSETRARLMRQLEDKQHLPQPARHLTAEQETRRFIGLIIGLPEFQRQ